MKMAKVSIIMGIYNCAQYLQEALDSLYNQSFQDFEIILCEDGSLDNTFTIAAENAKAHSEITLLRNEKNLGLNATLNKCLSVAQGEYIARMDGDDISMSDRLEKEVDFLDSHPQYAIVSTPMEYFDEDGVFRVGSVRGEIQKTDFIKGTPICHAPCMIRRDALLKAGGYSVGDRYLRVEDYNLWFKMYALGYKAFVLSKPYYRMRDDRNAKARRNWQGRINECFVMRTGFKMIGLPWFYSVFSIRPIIIGLLPGFIYNWLHKYWH